PQIQHIKLQTLILRHHIPISHPQKPPPLPPTLFLHKYPGYLAQKALPLHQIKSKLQALLPHIKTIPIPLTPPIVPTTPKNPFHIQHNQIQIAIGIHGE
ncbi:dihydroxyacetone kinase subunit DhaK, partial [Staphylococcus epidermidis]|uniref:dihydroxyacetone kinase subunit DhaK n=1 Tax=Staphylococcus epidermidis TaxID=1282 RepID=UPI0016434B05